MPDLNKVVKTMVVITGVKSEQIRGKKKKTQQLNEESVDEELGLEFI